MFKSEKVFQLHEMRPWQSGREESVNILRFLISPDYRVFLYDDSSYRRCNLWLAKKNVWIKKNKQWDFCVHECISILSISPTNNFEH